MADNELEGRIFSFEATNSDNIDKSELGLQKVIKNLTPMKGIEEKFIPTFRFFKVNKSMIEQRQKSNTELQSRQR